MLIVGGVALVDKFAEAILGIFVQIYVLIYDLRGGVTGNKLAEKMKLHPGIDCLPGLTRLRRMYPVQVPQRLPCHRFWLMHIEKGRQRTVQPTFSGRCIFNGMAFLRYGLS